MRFMPAGLLAATFFLAALLCAPAAWAAKVNPDGSVAPAGNQEQPATPEILATIKKAAEAQGEISPYTLKALERDPKALEAVGRAPAAQAAPAGNTASGPKSTKAIYGDIIIHK